MSVYHIIKICGKPSPVHILPKKDMSLVLLVLHCLLIWPIVVTCTFKLYHIACRRMWTIFSVFVNSTTFCHFNPNSLFECLFLAKWGLLAKPCAVFSNYFIFISYVCKHISLEWLGCPCHKVLNNNIVSSVLRLSWEKFYCSWYLSTSCCFSLEPFITFSIIRVIPWCNRCQIDFRGELQVVMSLRCGTFLKCLLCTFQNMFLM